MPSLSSYLNHLKRDSTRFLCPLCGEGSSSGYFELHCTQKHHIPSKVSCVWCGGAYKWAPRRKSRHVAHLEGCWHTFVSTRPILSHVPRALELVWPMPLELPRLTFQDASLTRAAATLQAFLDRGPETVWMHVRVPLAKFAAFVEALDREEGRVHTLPHSCWCRGAGGTLHRHLIVVGRFSWPGQKIQSPLQLLNAMGCCARKHHVHVFETLPKNYQSILCLFWEDGILDHLSEVYETLKTSQLRSCDAVEWCESHFRIRIKHFLGLPIGQVVPVSQEFQPCEHETPHYLHLIGGRKFYFEKNPDLCRLSAEEWIERQQAGGNLFYGMVGEEYFTPPQSRLRDHFQHLVLGTREYKEYKRLKQKMRERELIKEYLESRTRELEARIQFLECRRERKTLLVRMRSSPAVP